ncbi:hypothetical protein FOA52_010117 [Chlamydomonas sp. UWO 241]|nr:hypothetical protein FOA52_010117 [Chlamydomonas sp. UWO 241]
MSDLEALDDELDHHRNHGETEHSATPDHAHGSPPQRGGDVGHPMTRDIVLRAVLRHAAKAGGRLATPTKVGAKPSDHDALLRKQTHLHLNDARLDSMGAAGLQGMRSLEVLYLYDNHIRQIAGLERLDALTHLYLQNNEIGCMDGLSGLSNLAKLYLQGNYINRVTGIHNLPSLEELHLTGQKLPPGNGLTFDLHAMLSVSPTLRVLCASACGVDTGAAAGLPPLPQLRKLELADNAMEVVDCLEVVLRGAPQLRSLDVHGNPFCHDLGQRARDALMLMSDSVSSIDGTEAHQSSEGQKIRHTMAAAHVEALQVDQGSEGR